MAVPVHRLRVASGRRSYQPWRTTSSYSLSWTSADDLRHPARQLRDRGRPVGRQAVQQRDLERQQPGAVAADPADLPFGRRELAGPRQLGDPQMPADGEVDDGRGDVDRVDPLVGHRADVTGPDVADDPELALPRSGRHELRHPGDRRHRWRRPRRPDGAAGTARCRPSTSRASASPSGSGAAENARPMVQTYVDLLGAGHRAGREADVDLDDLALARADRRGRSASGPRRCPPRSSVHGTRGVGVAGGAVDEGEGPRDRDRRRAKAATCALSPCSSRHCSAVPLSVLTTAPLTV